MGLFIIGSVYSTDIGALVRLRIEHVSVMTSD